MEVRTARAEELAEFPDIERSAAAAFRGSIQDAIADDDVTPVELFIPFQADGLVLVAEDDDGALIGFAACQACEDALHVWELAVRRDRQGKGVGRALMAEVSALARRRGLTAVTLSTFRDIPWNAPFYARLGFAELSRDELNARLRIVLERERQLGLDSANRCAMRLSLSSPLG